MRTPRVAIALLAAALALLFGAGCGTSASCSRTTTNADAAVVRVYAKALVASAESNQNVALRFVGSHHVGRDVWVLLFRNKTGEKRCMAIELDRINLASIANNKDSGEALVSCSEFPSHK